MRLPGDLRQRKPRLAQKTFLLARLSAERSHRCPSCPAAHCKRTSSLFPVDRQAQMNLFFAKGARAIAQFSKVILRTSETERGLQDCVVETRAKKGEPREETVVRVGACVCDSDDGVSTGSDLAGVGTATRALASTVHGQTGDQIRRRRERATGANA